MRSLRHGLCVAAFALLGCQKPSAPAPAAPPPPLPRPTEAENGRAERKPAIPAGEEACVNAFLAERKLDEYGQPEGTMYAGGTPLFDERTGETRNRLDVVYAAQPEALRRCRPDGSRMPGP